MRLEFCKCFSGNQAIFNAAFHIIIEKLGIADSSDIVKLHGISGDEAMLEYIIEGSLNGGSVSRFKMNDKWQMQLLMAKLIKDQTSPLRIFCHEMVHVAQGVKGHLRMNAETEMVSWHDKIWPVDDLPQYKDMPWEIEARQLETGLYEAIKHLDTD